MRSAESERLFDSSGFGLQKGGKGKRLRETADPRSEGEIARGKLHFQKPFLRVT